MMSYGQAVASWNQYADANNLTPEQKQAGLDKLVKGDLPEGANITNEPYRFCGRELSPGTQAARSLFPMEA